MKITLTTAQAASLAKGIAPAISTDKLKLNLLGVLVDTTATESVTFTATDGYRLHRITVPQSSVDNVGLFALVGAELVSALLNASKAIGKASGVIELTYDYSSNSMVTGGGLTVTVPVAYGEFPACAAILDVNVETESGACYDTVYLADMVTAAGHISGKGKVGPKYLDHCQLVKIENIHPRKPMHVTAQSVATGMQFHGVLMPRRAS